MSKKFDLEKIKPYISSTLLEKFNYKELKEKKFIPLCEVSNGAIYVVISQTTDRNYVNNVIERVCNTTKLSFAPLNDKKLDSLFNYLKNLNINFSTENSYGETVAEESEEIDSENEDEKKIQIKYDENFNEDEIFNIEDENSEETNENGDSNNEYNALKETSFFGKKLGKILVAMGVITEDQIFNALVKTKKTQLPLGTILVQQGLVQLPDLKKALSYQSGFDTVQEDQLKISDEVLSKLPEDFIRVNKVIPISYDDEKKELVVGMVNPTDKKVVNEIMFITSFRLKVLLITHYEFQMCIQNFFSQQKRETKKLQRQVEKQLKATQREETLFEQAQRELKDDSNVIVRYVNKILSDGIEMKASDIHIEPRIDGYVVRYRKDGILRVALNLPENSESSILTRFKVMSKMNIAEHRRPQDGSFSISYKERDYDFRINTLPVGDGEKMVIRILAPAVSMATSKDQITLAGASQEEVEMIKKMESVPNGIILTTGPTGSGKTTTLYTLLKAINDEKINITTIEDPIEIRIDGINQSQINTKAGITFASCMRAILRQDPDVILVGEIRDIETLETAISAALTGHLVLSTLHTNSAASTITRLIDMGAKDYLVSSTLVGIIAQRLVRNLCPHCRSQYFPSREEAELVIAGGEREIQEFMKTPVYKPNGCEKCNFEGYAGRIGVYEIMPITKEIKKLIAQGAHDIQIEDAAVGAGMKTLHQVCLRHIIEGKTTISEFVRVLGPVKE